jgi:hypothetical protein
LSRNRKPPNSKSASEGEATAPGECAALFDTVSVRTAIPSIGKSGTRTQYNVSRGGAFDWFRPTSSPHDPGSVPECLIDEKRAAGAQCRPNLRQQAPTLFGQKVLGDRAQHSDIKGAEIWGNLVPSRRHGHREIRDRAMCDKLSAQADKLGLKLEPDYGCARQRDRPPHLSGQLRR